MSYKKLSPSPVVEGGTGAQTLTGVLIGNGTSAVTGNAVTQYDTLVGGASNAISSIAPSATAGVPLVSGGSSANPSYTTAVVAGGGTGQTSFTANAPIVAGGTSTAALAQVTTGLNTAGYVLTANSSGAPTFQAAGGGSVTIDGDSGSATGSTITLTGGSSGAVFTGSGSTVTESFNYLALPSTTSTNGQITINGNPVFYTPGANNTFVGEVCGNTTLSGTYNVALGSLNSTALTSGSNNIAIGQSALNSNQNTSGQVAIGYNSLGNINGGGYGNVAIDGGAGALTALTSGSFNIAIGNYGTGSAYTTSESSNILLNAWSSPIAGESNVLRIGNATGSGNTALNKAFICGINGISVTGSAVLVNSSDQLGITVSSKRWKENIEDMGEVSSPVLNLRPVTFTYSIGDDKSQQTGLIAEEVQEIMPSLVVLDKEGLPQTVKYHELPVLLLNELQKAVKRIDALEAKVSSYECKG